MKFIVGMFFCIELLFSVAWAGEDNLLEGISNENLVALEFKGLTDYWIYNSDKDVNLAYQDQLLSDLASSNSQKLGMSEDGLLSLYKQDIQAQGGAKLLLEGKLFETFEYLYKSNKFNEIERLKSSVKQYNPSAFGVIDSYLKFKINQTIDIDSKIQVDRLKISECKQTCALNFLGFQNNQTFKEQIGLPVNGKITELQRLIDVNAIASKFPTEKKSGSLKLKRGVDERVASKASADKQCVSVCTAAIATGALIWGGVGKSVGGYIGGALGGRALGVAGISIGARAMTPIGAVVGAAIGGQIGKTICKNSSECSGSKYTEEWIKDDENKKVLNEQAKAAKQKEVAEQNEIAKQKEIAKQNEIAQQKAIAEKEEAGRKRTEEKKHERIEHKIRDASNPKNNKEKSNDSSNKDCSLYSCHENTAFSRPDAGESDGNKAPREDANGKILTEKDLVANPGSDKNREDKANSELSIFDLGKVAIIINEAIIEKNSSPARQDSNGIILSNNALLGTPMPKMNFKIGN